jgi:hypothetical protein
MARGCTNRKATITRGCSPGTRVPNSVQKQGMRLSRALRTAWNVHHRAITAAIALEWKNGTDVRREARFMHQKESMHSQQSIAQ